MPGRGRRARLGCGLVLAFIAGCGSGQDADAGAPDAGLDANDDVDAAPVFEPEPPALPEPPAPPVLTPCPQGWHELADVDDPRIVRCEAWPESGPADCGPGEAHFPGRPGCERVGPACPKGTWATDLPEGATILRVARGAAEGGDGSEELPFATIAQAIEVAALDTVIALGRGEYPEPISVPPAVTIWGACTAETILAPPALDGGFAVLLARRGAGLRNVTIQGPQSGVSASGDDVTLDAVIVEGGDPLGVEATGEASLWASDLVIRDTGEGALGDPGAGLRVTEGSTVHLERGTIERSPFVGVFVRGGALTASDLSVRDSNAGHFDLFANEGATVTLERVAFDRSVDYAIVVEDGGTVLEATDLAIREVSATEATRVHGGGIVQALGARVVLSRVSVVGTTGTAVHVEDPLSELDVRDLVTADVRLWDTGRGGGSLQVGDRAVAWLERVALLRASGNALTVFAASRVTATDLIVRDTRRSPLDDVGDGVLLGDASLELTRAELTRCPRVGLFAGGLGTELIASDVTILESGAGEPANEEGEGILMNHGARATITRVLVESSRTSAIEVRNFPTELTAADVTVRGTRSRTFDDRYGVGLWLLTGARAQITRSRFEDGQSYGIVAYDPGSFALFEDLSVDGVAPDECAATTCPGIAAGIALSAVNGGALEVRRFVQRSAALCGVQVADGIVDLHEGEVRSNPIGASVQSSGYDLSRLQDEVQYLDNDRNLDSAELPVPDPAALSPFGEDP